MDLSKLSASQQLTVGAGAAMVLISFMPWLGVRGETAFSAWRSGLAAPLAVVLLVAAAVILDPSRPISGLRDSKKLTASKRDELELVIKSRALAWSVAQMPAGRDIQWADIDGNGAVEMADLQLLMERINTSPDTKNGYVTGDINLDGVIDTQDMMELVKEIQDSMDA